MPFAPLQDGGSSSIQGSWWSSRLGVSPTLRSQRYISFYFLGDERNAKGVLKNCLQDSRHLGESRSRFHKMHGEDMGVTKRRG
jgi:hypothetical protein